MVIFVGPLTVDKIHMLHLGNIVIWRCVIIILQQHMTHFLIPIAVLGYLRLVTFIITDMAGHAAVTCIIIYFMAVWSSNICDGKRKVLFVMFDGLRWDLPEISQGSNFERMAREGVKASWGVLPAVPTLTSPASWTMATGLNPEHHGVIFNGRYNGTHLSTFNEGLTQLDWYSYNNTQPIWTTARNNGKKVRVNRYPGMVNGFTHSDIFDKTGEDEYSINYYGRLLQAFKWFDEDDVDMVITYFGEPDLAAHQTGGDGNDPTLWSKLRQCDEAIGYIFWLLQRYKMEDEIDVIVTADHGTARPMDMALINPMVNSNTNDIDHSLITPWLGMIQPKQGKIDLLLQQMKLIDPDHMKVYKKKDFPSHWGWAANDRVLPLVIIPEYGYHLTLDNYTWSLKTGVTTPFHWKGGGHGWFTTKLDMRPIFYAMGPSFKKKYTSQPFHSVNIYHLLCHILGITPVGNDGSIKNVEHLLAKRLFVGPGYK